MSRTRELPDFENPPLNEVVMGIQFGVPANYQQIRAGEVWSLYKEHFPTVEEQPALAPVFETFGSFPSPGFPFQLIAGAQHDRFWFVSNDGAELIQFQGDRLLHNWRKRPEPSRPYPRFEAMSESFRAQVEALDGFVKRLSGSDLEINQCEISYINVIDADGKDFAAAAKLFSFLRFAEFDEPADLNLSYRRLLRKDNGEPAGRLHVELNPGVTPHGKSVYQFTLTARGAPDMPSIDSVMSFLAKGRDSIIREFVSSTTPHAHMMWERIA